MEKIFVNTPSKKYPIVLGKKVITELSNHLQKYHKNKKVVVITDDTVKKLHLQTLEKELPDFLTITIPPGEGSKSREIKAKIEDALLERNFGKDTLLIALGGGVIGDLTGFVASTYYRGIPFLQVPTTLLAMVDASIGGKTGINTEHGKNLIGTVYQPDAVMIEVEFLKTLPEEEFLNGLAEVIKIGCILDKDLFEEIEKHKEGILQRKEELLLPLINRSISLKKSIVENDEQETGLRQILNFGHTVGHALEAATHYRRWTHGEAIGIGMCVAARLSEALGRLARRDGARVTRLIRTAGLPTQAKGVPVTSVLRALRYDKKFIHGRPRWVLPTRIGRVILTEEVPAPVVRRVLAEHLR